MNTNPVLSTANAPPDTCAELLTNKLLHIAEMHVPHKRLKVRSGQAKWVTSEFLSLIDEKNHLCNKFRKKTTVENAQKRKDAMKRVVKMKRNLKRNYIQENLTRHDGDAKKTWQTI